ncbi:spermidine synthase [Streptomyces sp. ISL-96]|uniref:spermidine synthase n=1 Tax=Streptomyces sp. ISL-96 TaxID=2819191 RepID=UPI001BE8974C|nr:spermidine synthase [Streptomyces sp. ISL-96]MBT2491299.1 spermidine synthase [Streptomyces sp. ISL-96]
MATAPSPYATATATTIDRRDGPYGEVVLRERGAHFEIIANGCFLMDTSDGRSERLLIDAALDALDALPAPEPGRPSPAPEPERPALLIGGLGVGFSLARAAAQDRWGRITVIEREQAIIDWHREGPLARISGDALADPRCEIIHTDLVDYVCENRIGGVGTYQDRYDALCLDIDNGPDWTVTDDNANLYSPQGLAGCMRRLRPGGILAVWSAKPSRAFEDALRNAGFNLVRTEEIQVSRGVPDVVHLGVRPA